MFTHLRKGVLAFATLLIMAPVSWAGSTTTVTVDPDTLNNGFMNVFELGGAFVFASGWGFGDLTASYDGNQLTLGPNTVGDPNEFWYQCVGGAVPPDCGGPGAPGNKIMEANSFAQVDDGSLSGINLVFEGTILSNTLTADHEFGIFIRDFSPNYGELNETFVPITLGETGFFSIELLTLASAPGCTNTPDGGDPTACRHVQYGFQVKGVNVWATDVGPFGEVVVAPVPVPAAMWLMGSGLLGLLGLRRRKA